MKSRIAIVGMACHYPDARNPLELWENALAGRRAFRRIPLERLSIADYVSADHSQVDMTYVTTAAVIEGYAFDRERFRVSGHTYRQVDLAHWLALDVASRALDDAGFADGDGLPHDTTGVIVGNSLTGEFSRANLLRLRWPFVRRVVDGLLQERDWSLSERADLLSDMEQRYKAPFTPMADEALAGGLSNTIAGRICNYYDLHGGGFTVDGACSSSLLAVGNASMALVANEVDVVLAGGVDLSLDPFELVGFARVGALAEDEMRVYDQRPTGFCPGEGCGFVVLMREADALRQNRRVYATISGWGVSSDGKGGISRPEVPGQQMALRRAYDKAGFGPETISYFEGHGTGTAIGDTTELRALSELRRQAGSASSPAVIGSIKANIGHTKAAAGVAGLIKATMALQEQLIPPNTGVHEPHSILAQDDATLTITRQARCWPTSAELRAGVSAMGFGGINAHVVLQRRSNRRRAALSTHQHMLSSSSQDTELFLCSAPTREALRAQVQQLLTLAPKLSRAELADLATTLWRSLRPAHVRAAIVASTPNALVDGLRRLETELESEDQHIDLAAGVMCASSHKPPSIGYLFPGQASPVRLDGGCWRRRFESLNQRCDKRHEFPPGDLAATEIAQPAITAAMLAGLRILDELSITASVAVGHSLGELTAYHWAGAMSEADLLELAVARGEAMSQYGGMGGAMASIAADGDRVQELIDDQGVVIAALNSPWQTVISGEAPQVAEVVQRAMDAGLHAVPLRVSHGFHSPMMQSAVKPLRAILHGITWSPLERRVASTVTGGMLRPSSDLAALLLDQVTSPVRFTAAFEHCPTDIDLWVEVGPGHVLEGLARQLGADRVVSVDAHGKSLRGLLTTVAAVFTLGGTIQPQLLFEERFTRRLELDWQPTFFANPCELAPDRDENLVLTRPDEDEVEVGQTLYVPTPGESDTPTVEIVRQIVARRAELPMAAVKDDDRLLRDLHLSSIAVAQLVTEVARALDLPPPPAATEYTEASVAALAAALDDLRRCGPQEADPDRATPSGVDTWVGSFTVEMVDRPIPARGLPTEIVQWQLVAASDDRFADEIRKLLPHSGNAVGVIVCLPPQRDIASIDLLLEGIRRIGEIPGPDQRLVLIDQGWGGASIARTFYLENPEVDTLVIHVPAGASSIVTSVRDEILQSARGYTEVHYDSTGRHTTPVLRRVPEAPSVSDLPLAAHDLLLITGGGKGIGAECGLMLARETGARLVLLGRSDPEHNDELAQNLRRMQEAGVNVRYLRADVVDAQAVQRAVRQCTEQWGPITAVLHAAGTNEPKLLSALTQADFQRTMAAKVQGLEYILDTLEPDQLRLLVTFGSIIARTGMPGQADYALANAWLTDLTDLWQRDHPKCRCLAVEWSVWSGVGMGERLGRIEALRSQGITPISVDDGVRHLRQLLARPAFSSSVVATGRFGNPPTLNMDTPSLPLLRFLENPRVHVPATELVTDSQVSIDTDPYLTDHVYQGLPLMPAVVGLEAMAQVTQALTGGGDWVAAEFVDVSFDRPIIVSQQQSETIRVAGLMRQQGLVELVVRAAETGYHTDHFRAACKLHRDYLETQPVLLDELAVPDSAPESDRLLPLDPDHLYGDILFHRGRFRRLIGYEHLLATECVARIATTDDTPCFGPYLPQQCVLGDPVARDAVIHAIQACIPHATILPVGVERILIWRDAASDAAGELMVLAKERARDGDVLTYDVEVVSCDGRLQERWINLRLRRVGSVAPPTAWAEPLIGPYLQRRIGELLPYAPPLVTIVTNGKPGGSAADEALAHALGISPIWHRRPDGKPVVVGDEVEISIAHDQQLTMAVACKTPVACDLQSVHARSESSWRDLLGDEKMSLAKFVSAECGETVDDAATRIWTAIECFKKSGAVAEAPFTFHAQTDDGWVICTAGGSYVATWIAPIGDPDHRVACAILVTARESSLDKPVSAARVDQ